MGTQNLSLLEVERAIKKFEPEKQRKLLIKLPQLLKIKFEDLELLNLAESSFKFWENKEDSIYDTF
ncbi:TPA: hypothetical protein DEW49_05990 [bacterium]|nr:hypothetical protein [bacterium]